MRRSRPLLAITIGDPAGVGPEIVLKALARPAIHERCRPLVIGDARILQRAAGMAEPSGPARRFEVVRRLGDAQFDHDRITLLDLANAPPADCPIGQVSAASGRASVEYVFAACDLALQHEVDAMVTSPINKAAMNLGGHAYAGHTELLAERTKAGKVSMLLVGPSLRVVHVSTHVALEDAIGRVTRQRVAEVIDLAAEACRALGIDAPRIAVAGLNPHAGEGGLFGDQEASEIVPAIEEARARGLTVSDPQPPDTVFLRAVPWRLRHRRGHVSRPGTHPDEAPGVRRGRQRQHRPADHPHVGRPRDRVRHRGHRTWRGTRAWSRRSTSRCRWCGRARQRLQDRDRAARDPGRRPHGSGRHRRPVCGRGPADRGPAVAGRASVLPPADVVVLTSESRALPPMRPSRRTRRCATRIGAWCQGDASVRVYKKIDSTLRGHPAIELEVLMDTLGAGAALVAPAFPAQGRTTVGWPAVRERCADRAHGVRAGRRHLRPRRPLHAVCGRGRGCAVAWRPAARRRAPCRSSGAGARDPPVDCRCRGRVRPRDAGGRGPGVAPACAVRIGRARTRDRRRSRQGPEPGACRRRPQAA